MPLPVFNNFYNNLYTLLQYVYKKTLKIEGLPSNECIESKIRLKYSHCENAVSFLVHCSQLIFKACEPIVFKPSGGCEQLTLVGECGVLHQYTNNGMKLEPHCDLQLSSCDGVIALERDTEVRCDTRSFSRMIAASCPPRGPCRKNTRVISLGQWGLRPKPITSIRKIHFSKVIYILVILFKRSMK